MMKTKHILILCLSILSVLCEFGLAGADAPEMPAIGSWMLGCVYENASGQDRIALDPENAGALYSEAVNIYTFSNDGSAVILISEAGEIFRQEGLTWDENDGSIRILSEKNSELELSYDQESDTLHRFWKDEDPNASYHDLDFTYVRLPIGEWQMKYVVSTESGKDPVRLEHESAASLYTESSNVYSFLPYGNASVWVSEELTEQAEWELTEDDLVLKFENGDEMLLKYDSASETIHRYFKDDAPDAAYHELDFVYLRMQEE